MANFVYNKAKTKVLSALLNFTSHSFDVLLAMSNTTADSEDDAEFVSSFTTLDECDGANYARQTLAGQAVNEDLANDRAEFDANDSVFTNLGAGTRQNVGAVILRDVTNDTDSPPVLWIDTGGFPFDGTGSNNTIQWNAEGILQAA